MKWRRILHFSSTRAVSEKFPSIAFEASNTLLGSLCDFQVLTGTAIVIAAMAQLPELSFYHEQVAICLWWVTLNSFWAARIDQVYDDAGWFSTRMTLRKIGIFISVVLGVTFQVIINNREERQWQFNEEGRCYLYEDDSSSWPWIVGGALYGLTLLLDILPFARPVVKAYVRKMDRGQKAINGWCLSTFDGAEHTVSIFNGKLANIWRLDESRPLQQALSTVSAIIFFLFRQFLAIWSYGDGFYPLNLIACIGFGIWDTFDVLTLKILNKPLIVGGENKWGFGQVFPVIMVAATVFAAVDAFIGTISFPLIIAWCLTILCSCEIEGGWKEIVASRYFVAEKHHIIRVHIELVFPWFFHFSYIHNATATPRTPNNTLKGSGQVSLAAALETRPQQGRL